MKLLLSSPAKALNKAYLRQSVRREQMDRFKANLTRMFERIRSDEHEEHLKNIVADFLKETWYQPAFEINTSKRADLVIHNGRSSDDTIGVIIETKKPTNKNEMVTAERPNVKALHELLHYYMQERYLRGNLEVKRLIVCNIYEWYMFDAADFEQLFFKNRKFVENYQKWSEGLFSGDKTEWLYREILKPFVENELAELPCVCFDLRDYEKIVRKQDRNDDRKLIHLFKLLSPAHLLKQPFANDSNSLNKDFYNELLHIIGLEEVKEKGKKLIRRKPAGTRHDGSFLENTCSFLKTRNRLSGLDNPVQYGADEEEQLFSVGLELCITWLNRLLFLKLLEGQLISYHKGDRTFAFLNSNRITDFDELNELFFEVLAVREEERTASVREKFGAIPYLNSSLFEESDLERKTVRISELKNRLDIPLHGATVLKDGNGKRIAGSRNTLHYLFEFLDAYDFATEGSAEIQEQNKTIINAAVLGLIFEKINGYRDGSFFTPGFITMYMCRETIRRAVLDKFNERYGWSCPDLIALYNNLDRIDIKEANEVVNSLRICDPAVGSGHFLVSALNEILAIKSELGILADRDGRRLRGYTVTVENDEPIVVCDEQIFQYNYRDAESQRVQETLFHEKETIIENCLFGVDINPKSVAICRLRLWIELLKHAYYRRPRQGEPADTPLQLETLPNIDINIKCGNSLISRFAISGNPNIMPADRKKLKELTERYRRHVFEYKLSPTNKAQLRKVIDGLKLDLQNFGLPNDKDLAALRKKENEVAQLGFAFDRKGAEARKKLLAEVDVLRERFDKKQRSVYLNAFEWRFEFPEVLDDNGEFVGFDVVIGNPPYIRQELIKEMKPALAEMFGAFFCGTADIYTYFYKTGLDVAKPGGLLCYIAPNKFMRAGYGRNTRELLTTQARPLMVLDFGDLAVFDEATTYPSIVMVEKMDTLSPALPHQGGGRKKASAKEVPPPSMGGGEGEGAKLLAATFTDCEQLTHFAASIPAIGFTMPVSALKPEGWTLERPEVLALMEKLRKAGVPLGEYVGGKFYYGIKTGLNEAFVIDEATRQRLIEEDPKSAEIIKPWLRGRDIRKWKATGAEVYLITIASSGNAEWPWSQEETEEKACTIFALHYPAVHRHLSQYIEKLQKRDDRGRFWWELRACVYWSEFETTKIVYQEIATYQSFAYSEAGVINNNKCFLIPMTDHFLLGLLNSKTGWWFLCNLTSGLAGGARAMQMPYIQQLPVPTITDAKRASITELVEKILAAKSPPTPLSQRGEHVEPPFEKGGQAEGRGDLTDIPALEAEIDRLVYDLYGLTEDEIAIVEGRQS